MLRAQSITQACSSCSDVLNELNLTGFAIRLIVTLIPGGKYADWLNNQICGLDLWYILVSKIHQLYIT